jgi:methyl-accepting chemotaxis protein
MFGRVTVSSLLKSVIAGLAAAVVIILAIGAWDSWGRLTVATRIAAVTDASGELFKALHNLRLDRTGTFRDLVTERQLTAVHPQVKANRDAELPALRAAVEALKAVDFPDRDKVVSDLAAATDKLDALQKESAEAMLKPKAQRRADLAQDYYKHVTAMMENGEALSARLSRYVKLQEPFVDQLLGLKQLAWDLRNAGGDASLLISGPLGGQKMQADPLGKLAAIAARMNTVWTTLTETATGLPLPPEFGTAMQKVRTDLFAQPYIELRAKVIKDMVETGKTTYTAETWLSETTPKLATALAVAELALDTAEAHATKNRSHALLMLAVQSALLIGAILVAAALMALVSRRVTSPLLAIQSAMLKLAGGDMSAEASFPGRSDEIGKLASAMNTFKHGMIEADRMRSEQKEAEVAAAKEREAAQLRASEERKVTRERDAAAQKELRQKLADDFYSTVGRIIDHVSAAAGELERSATTLTKTAETTLDLTGVVASASEEASSNVGAVASAAEELTGSVNEIARQVQESSRIAVEAVTQAKATDVRIGELSQAAGRIGDVLKLITAIAEQTNLLALNATIEAARAGEAGKGFAVVASEVKALAAQTAKATEEIASQISDMQMATADSVGAIKTIGTTISRISEIAAAIAAAVEEQGAATGEIARNVTEASRGTAQVANTIGDVNRGATATGSASTQVLSAARTLAGESKDLKSEVEKFLDTVRAA